MLNRVYTSYKLLLNKICLTLRTKIKLNLLKLVEFKDKNRVLHLFHLKLLHPKVVSEQLKNQKSNK